MALAKVKLWTEQGFGHDITSARVLPPCNTKLARFYRQLWDLINQKDGQIIWCYANNPFDPPDPAMIRVKSFWTLEIPADKIVCYIDFNVWSQITDIPIRFPGDKEDDSSQGDPWERLIVGETFEDRTALVRCPIPDDWVIEKQDFQK
jgi:hypothetical protein